MTDNIHNLAIQAGLYCDGTPDSFDTAAVEKFTLLVIEKCVTIMHENERIPKGFLSAKNVSTHELTIKTYFGLTNERPTQHIE